MAERLTYRDESGKAWAKLKASASSEEAMNFGKTSLDRLAAYEDTGLTPEEIAALKDRTRWIPVSERLPEDVGSYLIYYHEWSNGDFLPKYDDYRIRVMRFMNNGKWCMPVCTDKRCEADTNREVTHWMPLPEPPKEVQM